MIDDTKTRVVRRNSAAVWTLVGNLFGVEWLGAIAHCAHNAVKPLVRPPELHSKQPCPRLGEICIWRAFIRDPVKGTAGYGIACFLG